MIRILWYYFWFTLLLLTLVTGYFLVESTEGLQLGLQVVAKFLPGELKIEKVKGTLFSAFTLKNLRYEDSDFRLTIQSLNIDWNPRQLWHDVVEINAVKANDVLITILPTASNHSLNWDPESLKTILSHLVVRNVDVNQIRISENQKTALIHLKGELAEEWNVHWNGSIPDIHSFLTDATGDVYSEGTLSGNRSSPTLDATITSQQIRMADKQLNQFTGKMRISLQPKATSFLTLTARNIKIADNNLQNINLGFYGNFSSDNKNYLTTLDVIINKQNYGNVTVSLPNNTSLANIKEEPLSIKLKFDVPQLQAFASYIPETKNLLGKIVGTLELNGTVEKLTASGDVNLMNGSINIPKLGLMLHDINLHAYGTQSKELTYKGFFHSNSGTAEIEGETNLAQLSFPTNLHITGQNLEVIHLPDYKIAINPDLLIQMTSQSFFVKGNIVIPEAHISPKDFRTTVTLPADVVFTGSKKPSLLAALTLAPAMQVTVNLGNKIHIHYQDFEASLRGSLSLRKSPHSMITASGELSTVNGTYQAYHHSLSIQEGHLIYTGGILTNPGLNIKATRQLKTVVADGMNGFSLSGPSVYNGSQWLTVGVQILGSYDAPQISLFSDPANLTQTNILSYLLLGSPAPQSGSEKSTIMSAASALNLAGSGTSRLSISNVTNQLQKSLGLSELNVQSVQSFDPTANLNQGGTVDNTSLVLGKEIGHNLSIHSSVSLFATPPVYTLNVQYKIGKHWSIQSETSTIDTGADLMYSIERD